MTGLTIEFSAGESLDIAIRQEQATLAYKTISGMSQTAPLRVTATGHGLPNGWRAGVQNAKGANQFNVPWNRIRDADLQRIKFIDANTVEFPAINAAAWPAWTSGGQLVFYPPLDLSIYTKAELIITNPESQTETIFSSADGKLEIDTATASIWIRLPADTSAEFFPGEWPVQLLLTRVDGIDPACPSGSIFLIT
jgi:hypothetical protein